MTPRKENSANAIDVRREVHMISRYVDTRWTLTLLGFLAFCTFLPLSLGGCSDDARSLLGRFDKNSQLVIVARSGKLAEVRKLLDEGANVNGRFGGKGDTPLLGAVSFGQTEVVRLLLTRGADVNATFAEGGGTALDMAAYKGNAEIAKVLLEAGADPNIRDARYGWTPLHAAAKRGNAEIVQLLISHGADINARNNDGNTALYVAKVEGREEIVAMLKRAGAHE